MSKGKTIRRLALASAIIIVLILIAGCFLVRSAVFHRYVIARANQKIGQATGGRSEIGSYSVALRPLVVTVNHLVIHGTESAGTRPLLETERIRLELNIASLLRGKINLNDMQIERPAINLIVDRNSQSNLPQPQATTGQSASAWDLGIQRLVITNGEIYYSSQATPLTADLHDLLTRVDYDVLRQQYVGELSYHRGRLQFGDYRPIDHELDAHFTASPSGMNLDPLALRLASSELNLRAAVNNYDEPVLHGDYRMVLNTEDLRQVLRTSSLPVGVVIVSGSLSYRYVPGRSPLETFVSTGRLRSPGLLIETSSLAMRASLISGEYEIRNGDFVARDLRADLLGGELDANLSVRDVAVKRVSSLRASLEGVSIQEAAKALHATQVPLAGRARADLEAGWRGSLEDLRAMVHASLHGVVTPPKAGAPPTPLTGILQADYTSVGQALTLTKAQFETPASSIRMSGPVGNHSNLQIQASTSDLHEWQSLFQALAPATAAESSWSPSHLPSIFGTALLTVTVQGSLSKPHINGQLTAQNLQIEDTHWRALQARFTANPSEITVEHGSLVSAGSGSIQFDAHANLDDWRYLAANPLSVHLDVTRMPIDQLAQAAKLSYSVSGILSAQLSLHGSQLNPVGAGTVRIIDARVEGTSVPRVALDFQGTGDAVHATASASLAGGDVHAVLNYDPRNRQYTTRMEVQQLHLDQIKKAQALYIRGSLSASATGHGTLEDPQLSATASIPQLEIHRKTISGFNVQVEVANKNAKFVVNSSIAQSSLQARGSVALTGDKYATVNFDSSRIALRALLAAYLPAEAPDIQGELELHATASGPITRPLEMQAQLQVPVFTASYKEVHIAAARPIVANYRNGIVRLEPAQIKGTGTDINLAGSIPIMSKQPADITATGGIDLGVLHMFDPDLTSTGRIELDIHGAAFAGTPGIHGQVRLVNAAFTSLSTPMGVEDVNGVFAITNDEIQVQSFAGHIGGGDFAIGGTVGYRPAAQFNLTVKANHVRLLYPEGLRTILQGDLLLAGSMQSAELKGRVLLESMSFSQGFDLASFVSQSASASAGTAQNQGFAEKLRLNIAVQSASDLGLTSSEVSLQGSINLKLIGTVADPVILGRADIISGELFFMGRRYQVQRGVAQFNNPSHTEPILNFLVTTTVNQYDLSLSLIGPLDHLRTHYVSDPPLPPVDIINLLARGQTTEEAASAPANMGANQLIASGVASQVSGGLQKLAGISSLQIDPLIGGSNRNPGARVSIQQRVTKNFFFTYSTDVNSTQGQIVQGEYQLTKRWSVSAVRNQFGNIGVDAKFHKAF